MAGHLDSLRSALILAVDAFNDAVGSFEKRVLPAVRRFKPELSNVKENLS